MKYSQLLKKCQQLLDTYNENLMTADSHAEEFLAKCKYEDTQRVFLKQIFYGYERYKGFLRVSNEVIFQDYATMCNRKNDYTLFAIFSYLVVFRMDQLPFAQFKKMVLSQDMVKMHVLLSFIFDLDRLKDKVFPGWREFLQEEYLDSKIFPALAERKNRCSELISKVSESATGKRVEHTAGLESIHSIEDLTKDKKKPTLIQEFKLTKPKPKQLPEVEKIEIGFKANPAPKANKDLKKIQEEKKDRRTEIRSFVKTSYKEKEHFALETSKRPANLPKLKQENEKKHQQDTMKKTYSRPVPKLQEVEVKLNVAAILREEKKLNQKLQEEEDRMKNLEINMRDESEFENWQKEMKDKDRFDQMEVQQRRKIEMELAREAAMEAYTDNVEQKRQLVEGMKEVAADLRGERDKLEAEDLESKKKVIEEVQEIQGNIKVEQEKVVDKNKKLHDVEKEERRRIQDKKKDEDRVELLKKKELISQIRELESSIRAQPKTEIEHISIGLLEELTLDQLKYRLVETKQEQKQEEESRRQQNMLKKETFKEVINQKKNAIFQHREELARQKEEERRKKKEDIETEKRRLEEVKIKSMNQYKKKEEDKARERKLEKEKLAKEIKETDQRRMFLMQGQAAQENNAFMNLERGEEREMLDRQNQKLMHEYQNQSVKDGEMKIIAEQGKRIVQQKIEFNRLYNEQQHLDNQNAETMQQEDQVVRAMQYHNVKTFEQKHVDNMTKLNPFKTKIASMSLSKSKTRS